MEDSTNPPPDKTRETIFSFVVGNANQVCDEEVKITKILFKNDPRAEDDKVSKKKGISEFLGFKRNLDHSYSPELSFVLEDETVTTIFFGVRTGEDNDGCDFRAFKVIVGICDTGPKCSTCCDWSDPPCEPPTPYKLEKTIDAAPLDQPSGTGKIYGKVSITGTKLRARVSARLPNCVIGLPDNTADYSDNRDTSKLEPIYEFENIPFGTYEVTARYDGNAKTEMVTIDENNPEKEKDFQF